MLSVTVDWKGVAEYCAEFHIPLPDAHMGLVEIHTIRNPGTSVAHAGEENQTMGVACTVHSTATRVIG